ncbi:MAG: gliding motility lipoprotein GldD [Bacteroidota bacterium]
MILRKRFTHILVYNILLSATACFLTSCGGDYVPKPRGFFRIDLPQKTYIEYNSDCPFLFEYPTYAMITPHVGVSTMPCWMNIDYPEFKGRLHLSYFALNNDLEKYLEDSRKLAYKHTIKAEAIDETLIKGDSARVHGLLYNIEGISTASSVQFFLTDSTNHFLRGALYFNVSPRNDSLAPVINFIREDIFYFIESFRWKR